MKSNPAACLNGFLLHKSALFAVLMTLFFAGCNPSSPSSTTTCTVGKSGECPSPSICRGTGPKGQCCNPADPACGAVDALSTNDQGGSPVLSDASSADHSIQTLPDGETADSPAVPLQEAGAPPTHDGPLASGGNNGSDSGTGGASGAGGGSHVDAFQVTVPEVNREVPLVQNPDGSLSEVAGFGGAVRTGGAVSSGGVLEAGGAPGNGGIVGTGGATATAGTTVGAGGTATGGNSGAGGSTPSCGVSPVDPNATVQARRLLCYLYSIYGDHVLSGQQEANWSANPVDFGWYASSGIKTPAVLGSDFGYHGSAGCTDVNVSTTRAIAHWNAGGLVMYRYHMGLPAAGSTCAQDCYNGTNCSMATPPSGFFDNVTTAGTPENTSLNAKLDYMAAQISAMQDANMPVIVTLFHEIQPNGWFWWSMGTASQYMTLYSYAYDYLMNTKGLHNIIRLLAFSDNPIPAFWPGSAAVDIAGTSTYGGNPPFVSLYNSVKGIVGSTMPIALIETAVVPQPPTMFPNTAPWLLWNISAGYELTSTPFTSILSAYADAHTITRDEIPNLK